MAFDQSTLPQVVEAQEFIDGLRNEMPDLDEQICDVRTRDAVSGTIPYLAAKDTLGQDRDPGSQALGADPRLADFELSTLTYNVEQYGEMINVPKSIVIDADQYMSTMQEMALSLLENNAFNRESDLATLLTNSSYAEQVAVGNGAWSISTSTPVADILKLKRTAVPVVDTVIIGATSADELMTHPDITAMAGLAYASGAAVPTTGLQEIIGKLLKVDPSRVFVWDRFYNSAKYGQTATLARVTNDFFWAGTRSSVKKVNQTGMVSALTLIEKHTCFEQSIVDVCDYVATPAGTFRGGELTGL